MDLFHFINTCALEQYLLMERADDRQEYVLHKKSEKYHASSVLGERNITLVVS